MGVLRIFGSRFETWSHSETERRPRECSVSNPNLFWNSDKLEKLPIIIVKGIISHEVIGATVLYIIDEVGAVWKIIS